MNRPDELTHTVIMPNGMPITGVPIDWGVPEIMEAAHRSLLFYEFLNLYPLAHQQQSNRIH